MRVEALGLDNHGGGGGFIAACEVDTGWIMGGEGEDRCPAKSSSPCWSVSRSGVETEALGNASKR